MDENNTLTALKGPVASKIDFRLLYRVYIQEQENTFYTASS